jgi:mRNA interferase MazF
MSEGDVVLAALPQADGRIKNRPALVLRTMPPHGDVLVCGISTQLHQEVPGFDDVVASVDPDFEASGLKAPSLIRLGFLASLPAAIFIGRIGTVATVRHVRLVKRLAAHLLDATSIVSFE